MKHEPRKKKQTIGRLPLGHRALALLLALLMVFTATGMQVFAEGEETDSPSEPVEESTPIAVVEETPAETTTTPEQTTVETPAETTPSETPDQTTDVETTETPAEPTSTVETTEPSTEPTETPAETQPVEDTTTTPPDPFVLTDYIKKSAMNYYVDQTPTDISGQTVTVGSYVSVTLEFGKLEGLEQGQTLTYSIPSYYMTAYQVTESDNAKAYYEYVAGTGEKVTQVIGTYTVSDNLVTIKPDESYLNADTGKIDLPGGQFTFTGKLCLSAGEQSLTFGKADPIQFTVKAATSTRRRAAQSTSSTYDLTNYLTSDSSIIVIIDNKEYTLDELQSSGREVPEGAGVKVQLYFSSLKNIPSGATLTYQIPPALAVQATSQATKLLDSKTFETLGTFIIDETGLIKVTIDDSYHSKYQDSDGTLDLEGFNLSFSGSFSDSAGQVDGSDDNVIRFSGTAGSNDVSFTIPFDYKNDHANVQIEKTGAFTSATTIKYTVTVKAPDDNIEDAYNVVVTDKITAAKAFIKPDEKNDDVLYRNVTVTNGTFDAETGVWTLGEDLKMKPGQTETLTYEFEVSDDYYTNNPNAESVRNTATVTFNESGKNDAENRLGAPGTVLLSKEYNDSLGMVKDDKGTYITYTLTATAYGSAQDGIVVSDAFTTKDYISSIETDGTYQGTVEIDNTAKSVTWTVGSLAEGASATLTYKAYLDDTAWEKGASFNELFQYLGATKTVKNTATVSVNNGTDTSVEPLVTNTKTTETQIQKKWLVKDSSKIDSGPHSGTVQFTIRANPAPSSNNISTIWDKLTDGTYEDGGVITIKRFLASSSGNKLVDTTEVNVSDVLDSGSTTSWTIDLKNVPTTDGKKDLSGAYYYEVSYYVVATGVSVTNDAGLGLGNGAGFQITKVAQGASGWSWNSEYSKENVGLDYETGEDKWRVTLKKNVTEGMAVYDTVSTEYVYKNKSYWFDSKTLEGIVVKQGDTVLELNKDYTVELLQDTSDGHYKNYPVAPEVRSDGIQINFLHDIEVTGSNDYVTIDYSVMFDTAAYSASDTKGFWRANWVGIKVMQFGQLIAQDKQYKDPSYSMNQNIPLTKSNGTYHESDGTITWNIEVNKLSTVGGDATLIDLLPEGLTFYSAEIIAMGALAEDNTHRTATTMNGVGKNVVLYAKDCDVEDYSENGKNYSKVSLYIKDLSRFEAVSGGELVKNTYDSVVGTNHSGYAYGRITVQITAKVNPEYLVTLEKKAKITNTAILTDNDYLPEGGVTATGDATIPGGGSTVLSKSQATTEAPAYVQFALDINSNALDLVADDGSLSIDDVMGSGMSLATQHRNFVQVYDVTNVSDLYDSDGNVVAEKAATGSDITGQCSWENITTDTSKPTYRFTVPDGKHVVIVYWASFNGAAGQSVQLSNNAYFFYEGKDYTNNSSKWSSKLQVSNAEGSAYTNPYFYLEKTDQWGNNVSGAEFGLYKYVKDGDDILITTRTTEDGEAYIGKRSTDSFAQLELNTIYAIQEIKAPTGYELDSTEHYFEFATITGTGTGGEVTDQDVANHQANHPNGITVVDLTPGGTYTVTNTFTGASLTIPIVKTINGKNLSSTTEFSFTLKQTDGDPVYTDSNYKSAVPSTGLTTTITGSGSESFDLYFKSTGNYTFTVTENDLSDTAKKCGYTEKDATTYTLNVTVGAQNGAVAVTSATYSTGDGTASDFTSGSVLTFNNKLSLSGSMKLQVKKTVSGRTEGVKAGEFSFNVLKNGNVIKDKDGNELVFYTQQGGLVDITIPLTQDDIGTQDFVIKEIVPTGSDADPSISYTASPVIATVTISEIPATANTTASVAATSDVTYYADDTDSDGIPLMVNKYSATGTLTLHGTKRLYYGNQLESIRAKEFNFVVMEGNTKVATGTTIKELDDNIVFTDINYVAADIGRHTYTITEVNDGELFVEYTDKVVTVTVDVYDKGKGELGTTVAYSGDTDNKSNALFVNTLTFKVPTGIRLDVLPYVLILVLALALGGGALVLRRRKHTKN